MAATGAVFLGAALAVGWTIAEVVSASLNTSRHAERIGGCGVAMAWPHLSACLMRTVDDPLGGSGAAAAINTVRSTSGVFSAGLAGVVVNLTTGGELAAGRSLFAVLTVIGLVGSFRTVGR